jgi:UDP-N-acetylmuramoyl-L-alanyl-D-glutamate--2,6-diaminopimelate ligase
MNRFTQDGVSVFVDYAHTEDALRHVLGAVRELKPNRIITVFGCGGDRDQSKRGPMGLAAVHGSDVVVLTSDNPRHESPESIADDVVAGWGSPRAYNGESGFLIQLNREMAIQEAVSLARQGDVILVAGKGHEQVQDMGGVKVPFDDQLVVQKALMTRKPGEGVL